MQRCLSSVGCRFIILSLIFLFVFSIPTSWSYSPAWLKEGTYAKYGTAPVVFRWECLSIEGTTARLNISLVSSEEGENINLSTILNVDTETRDVTLLNGSAFGKTLLWLPANPENGETIYINGETAEIRVSGNTGTPQGAQRIFLVTDRDDNFYGFYDLDTGVRISGFSGDEWIHEGTIKALGIKNRWIFLQEISETNIDLGPRELWPEIGRYLIFAPLVAVFIVVPIFILRRRQKRTKMMKRLNRKTTSIKK